MYPFLYESEAMTIGSYGLMLAIAYLLGRWYFLNTLEKTTPKINNTELLIVLLLIFGVSGAKLMFLLKNPDKSELLLSGTGFSSQGAIIGALFVTYFFCFFNKIKLHHILDAAAPAAILAYTIARMGCFLSGDDCYGIPTDLAWAMSFPNGIAKTTELVHPVPLYEILYSSVIFLFLLKRKNANNIPYSQFFYLLGLWGLCRFSVEFVSSNPKILFSMSGSQIGALLMLMASITFFTFSQHNKKPD